MLAGVTGVPMTDRIMSVNPAYKEVIENTRSFFAFAKK
jgi:hypothetical protein